MAINNKINALLYVTHLHKTICTKSRFLHVEIKNLFCRAQSVLQFGENQKLILFFYLKLWNFENSETNDEKMAVKEKEPYFKINHLNELSKWP